MPVAALQDLIDPEHFNELQAAERLSPRSIERFDVLAGIIAAAIYNVNRDPSKGRPLSYKPFLPRYEKRYEDDEFDAAAAQESMIAFCKAMAAATKDKSSADNR